MARIVWVVRALRRRPDEGWERLLGRFRTEQDAVEAIFYLWPLIRLENYATIKVVRTIEF
jgi:hypothetical protein